MAVTSSGQHQEDELREFPFCSGRRCLDFVATLGSRGDLNIERLKASTDLARWTAMAGFGQLEPTRRADVGRARDVREAIFTVAVKSNPPIDQLRLLNTTAARTPLQVELTPARTLTWTAPVTLDGLLSTLVREAFDLVTGSLANRIKTCAGPRCTIAFVDESRPGTRRWCAMERCGNRAKADSLRSKRRRTASRS